MRIRTRHPSSTANKVPLSRSRSQFHLRKSTPASTLSSIPFFRRIVYLPQISSYSPRGGELTANCTHFLLKEFSFWIANCFVKCEWVDVWMDEVNEVKRVRLATSERTLLRTWKERRGTEQNKTVSCRKGSFPFPFLEGQNIDRPFSPTLSHSQLTFGIPFQSPTSPHAAMSTLSIPYHHLSVFSVHFPFFINSFHFYWQKSLAETR